MQKQTILIIDDIPENIHVLYQTLKGEFTLFGTTNGMEALEMASLHDPDLILLDVMMPELDGNQICAMLKRDETLRDIPVIFVTAKTDFKSETKALAAGAVDFIHKPFNTEVVRARVRLHLELARQRESLELLNLQLASNLNALRDAHDRLKVLSTAIEHTPASVIITDTDGVIQYVNPAFSSNSGYTAGEAIGQKPRILRSGKTSSHVYQELWNQLDQGKPWFGEFVNRHKSGDLYCVEAHIAPVKDSLEKLTHYVAVNLDITQRKEAQQRLEFLANHDALTNLPNRALFFEQAELGLALAKRKATPLALMFIDLDNFKPINDTYGHAAGDVVLREVAQRLTRCVREADCVGRIGGDEFIVGLMEVHDSDDAIIVANKIRDELNLKIIWNEKPVFISSSIGIALYPQHGECVTEIISKADQAMYWAKTTGKNSVKMYSAGLSDNSAV